MLPRYENKVKEIQQMITALIEHILKANKIAMDAYSKEDNELYESVKSELKSFETDANTIDNEIVKTFALFGPEAQELRMLVAYLKMTNELVRISEGTKKYARRMREHRESECDLTPFNNVVIQLHKSVLSAVQYIHECFENIDTCNVEEIYRKVMVEESKNDDLFSILEKDIMTQIISTTELSVEYVKVLGTLRKLERICDRSVNIANLMLFGKEGGEIKVY
jgi:phosphate transport system protein